MAFPPALTATQLDVLRTGQFHYPCYLLFWRQNVIFQAQVNQSSFDSSFAQITYDNVSVGAYTDLKADFVCYVSTTAGDLKSPEHVFRVRADGSGTVATSSVLNINETSAAITDDWYIMVVKDVRCEAKMPRTIQGATPASNSYARDYAITFRRLKPIIYGLETCYVAVLNSDGVADIALPAQVLITDNDASADTTAWDIDGLSYQVGDASTLSIIVRASAAGQYMPRITHTDSLGNTGYFTTRIFVVPTDRSGVVNLAVTNPIIQRDTVNGHSLRMNANAVKHTGLITRIDQYPDLTFVAVWFDTNQPVITSNIAFVGWITAESVDRTFSPDRNELHNTHFTVDGVLAQFADVISRRLPMIQDTTPAAFGEIEDLTPWRAIAYFLTEHTTLPNLCAVTFDDTSEDYRYPRFGSGDSSAIDSVLNLIFTVNGGIDCAATGEIEINRVAWMLSSSDRNALTTVAEWTTTDMAVSENGGLLFNLSRGYMPTVGRVMAGGGIYNTTTEQVQILRAITPAVAQSRGNQLTTLNRQILAANSDVNTGAVELGQRAADDMAARQPQTILTVDFPPAYHWLTPHKAQWHTWTINKSDNNRGIEYDTSTRWILRSLTLSYDSGVGFPRVQGQLQKETQGTGYQTLVTQPLDGEVQYYHPVIPLAPTYASFPEDPTAHLPDPSNPTEADMPPFSAQDQMVTSTPQDPSVTYSQSYTDGAVGMIWDADSLWGVRDIPGIPTYTDYTPPDAGTITNGKFDPFGKRAAAVSNDGTDTIVHTTKAFGALMWTSLEIEASPYTRILFTQVINCVYLHTADAPLVLRDTFTVDGDESDFTDGTFATEIGKDYIVRVTGDIVFGAPDRRLDAAWASNDGTYTDTLVYGPYANFEGEGTNDPDDTTFNSAHIYDYTRAGDGAVISMRVEDSEYGDNSGSWTVYVFEITTGNAVDTRYTDDFFATVENPVRLGDVAGDSGAATQKQSSSTKIFVTIDDEIDEAVGGGAYSAEANGDTTGTYAVCIASFPETDDAYLFGTAAALGGETLFIVQDGARTAITPNDGSNDGIVVGPDALAMARSDQRIFALCSFGGTVKLAYSADQGATWQFNTQVSGDACYVRAKQIGGMYNVYVCDGATLWWGKWDGESTSTLTLVAKTSPSTALLGVEIR